MSSTTTQQIEAITLDTLESHSTQESLWIAVHGHVYDLTTFSVDHPGGVDALLSSAGTDGSEAYEYAGHSKENMDRMQQYRVGQLAGSTTLAATPSSSENMSPALKVSTRTATKPSRTKLLTLSAVALASLAIAAAVSNLDVRIAAAPLLPAVQNLSSLYQDNLGISWGGGGNKIGHAFWAGMAMASSVSLFGFRYLYMLFLSSLELQKDVFSFPPTIPRKMRR